ncbi:MAG: tRNA-dihydrouridine synthase, partial [Henriciella sp.]|uniref:tRNA-dihydrouridine synthase n=1 Tax=Henriciella sp. TaxID=1968823 RepID=UPI003C729581
VIANGDIASTGDALTALRTSGAYGVMIGRAAMGRPWLLGEVTAALQGKPYVRPDRQTQLDSLIEQIEDTLSLYGASLGARIVRKHVAACIDHLDTGWTVSDRRTYRSAMCQIVDPKLLISGLQRLYLDEECLAA